MADQPTRRARFLTFNDPHPMRIDRDLAREIGLNESIVLLQLEYLIGISSNERDGRLWTYQSLQDLKDVYFPWWSLMTISRIIRELERLELIVIGNYNKLGYDRTQWFALNEEGLNKLTSVKLHMDAIYQNDKSIYQNGEIHLTESINRSQQNVTTIPEITHEITQKSTQREKGARAKARGATQATLDSLNEAVAIYKELTGKRTVTPAVASLIADRVTDMQRWRDTVKAWCGKYRAENVTGMLEWYDNPKGQGNGKHLRSDTRQPAERAQWTSDTSDIL